MNTIWPISKIDLISLEEVVETRPVALVYSEPAWQEVKDKLRLPVAWEIDIQKASESYWRAQLDEMKGEVVYAVGGGLPADAAKYLAAARDLPLVCVPTALSVDAFVTWASGVRESGGVKYLETKVPENLLVDLDVIAAAPAFIRAAGICDVLSIATGSWDWRFAEEKGMNPPEMPYSAYVDQAAQAILQGALDCAEAAGRGSRAGLKQLLDVIALEVQLCNQVGHSRPEEGSEHYFAYAVENELGYGLPHAELLGPGILAIAQIQGQDTRPLKEAMLGCQINLGRVPQDILIHTLKHLPDYSRKHDLPYGIAHELNEEHLEKLQFA